MKRALRADEKVGALPLRVILADWTLVSFPDSEVASAVLLFGYRSYFD